MFSEGNFTAPMLIHAQEPPGVAEMKRAGAAIGYTYEPLPRGGRVILSTASHLNAIHDSCASRSPITRPAIRSTSLERDVTAERP